MSIRLVSETREEHVSFNIRNYGYLRKKLGQEGRYISPVHQVQHTRVRVSDNEKFVGRDLGRILDQMGAQLERSKGV